MLTRIVFVLLVVLNLGVAAWWLTRRPTPDAVPVATLPGVPLLRLVGEPLSASPAPPPPVPQSTSPVAMAASIASIAPVACARLGPFDSQDIAQAGRVRLPGDVQARIAAQAPRGRGWRVIVPPLADAAQAQAMAARLTAAGFADNFVMRTGRDTHAVALGRFGNEAAARRHAQAVTAAGIDARAEPLGAAQWWLEVGVADAARLPLLRAASGAAAQSALDCALLAAPAAG